MADDLFGDRLLVIDDDLALGSIIKKVAAASGFQVVVSDNAAAFMNAARLWHPSVVMLDLKMPDTDGIQLLRQLAADKCAATVVLTSGADGKVLDSALQLGRERGLQMGEVLPKPIRVEGLRQCLATHKRRRLHGDDLEVALAEDQLYLEYQPKLDCRLGRITGAEALVRWRHPSHGIIPPDRFIWLAEETALIHRVTDRVMREAAAQAARWRADGLAIEVAINISAKDVEDIDLPDRLEQHCRAAAIDPSFLTLELTETGAMREAVQMMDVLTRLRIKGFKLSIDDFGTGYSSLVQLQKMPFSEIKIDRSFVMAMADNSGCRVIVEIVVDLARKLGLTSIAEGVEDAAALAVLTELGCDLAQGYHVARPMEPARIAPFVAQYEAGLGRTAA